MLSSTKHPTNKPRHTIHDTVTDTTSPAQVIMTRIAKNQPQRSTTRPGAPQPLKSCTPATPRRPSPQKLYLPRDRAVFQTKHPATISRRHHRFNVFNSRFRSQQPNARVTDFDQAVINSRICLRLDVTFASNTTSPWRQMFELTSFMGNMSRQPRQSQRTNSRVPRDCSAASHATAPPRPPRPRDARLTRTLLV